jgi:tetrahydromethanopterin S-methyltransferase subunit B
MWRDTEMAYIQILPEFGLVADPLVGLVTSAGESFSPVLEKIAVLEATSDDLINMLSGSGNMLASFPNRENGLAIGGTITSFWYGLAIGLFIAGIVAFQLIKVG